MRSRPIRSVLSLAAAFAVACAPVPPQEDPKAQPPRARAVPGQGFVLEAGDIAVEELIDQAARFLNRNVLYNPAELAAAGGRAGIRLQKRIELDALGCEELLASLLYVNGFAVIPLDADKGFYEVVAIHGPRGREVVSRPIAMDPDQVLRRPQLKMVVVTTVQLRHINAVIATNALRPFFSSGNQPPGSLTIGNVGNQASIVLLGFADQVAAAIRLLRECDRPEAEPKPDLEQRLAILEQQVRALLKPPAEKPAGAK